jgi:hypothetical protein
VPTSELIIHRAKAAVRQDRTRFIGLSDSESCDGIDQPPPDAFDVQPDEPLLRSIRVCYDDLLEFPDVSLLAKYVSTYTGPSDDSIVSIPLQPVKKVHPHPYPRESPETVPVSLVLFVDNDARNLYRRRWQFQ